MKVLWLDQARKITDLRSIQAAVQKPRINTYTCPLKPERPYLGGPQKPAKLVLHIPTKST